MGVVRTLSPGAAALRAASVDRAETVLAALVAGANARRQGFIDAAGAIYTDLATPTDTEFDQLVWTACVSSNRPRGDIEKTFRARLGGASWEASAAAVDGYLRPSAETVRRWAKVAVASEPRFAGVFRLPQPAGPVTGSEEAVA
ncbi:hypothetical protein [Gordonia malaquae]|uniref:hypothetical protein n=1 Tax=Gordonia malaquae TaxID=410332 RepID=UPI003016B131